MITRPEMATGTGSVTQRKMPATMRASAIFPAKERPSGVGASQPSATMAQAIPKQAKRFLSEGPVEAGTCFPLQIDPLLLVLRMKRLGHASCQPLKPPSGYRNARRG